MAEVSKSDTAKVDKYAEKIIEWCDLNGVISFYHSELPNDLQSKCGTMVRLATRRGYFKQGFKNESMNAYKWDLISRFATEPYEVKKYATVNVDSAIYDEFKEACKASDMTILEAMNKLMTKFVEKSR